jgi:Bacterial extracellular solute-binding proteins, family 3
VAAEPQPAPEAAPVDVAAATPEPAPEAFAPAADPAPFPYRLVTGNGYAPFADEMLPGGGMFTQLVEMAIFRADPAIPYNLTFVNDWQAHIDALLPSGAYDLSFPWVRPDCEAPDALSAGDLARCENFEFSAPLYEIVDGFFMPSDSDLLAATSYTAFEGKRICRPEGYTTGVLEAAGLTGDKIELSRPIEVTDCFEEMAAGKIDLVSIDAEVGDSAIAELGMTGDFAQNPHLMTLDSLHVIAHKSNARAVEMIRMMDEGVIEMYESGEWYDIVSSALARGALQQ